VLPQAKATGVQPWDDGDGRAALAEGASVQLTGEGEGGEQRACSPKSRCLMDGCSALARVPRVPRVNLMGVRP